MYQLCNKAPRPVTCRGPELLLQFDTLAVLYPKRPVLTQDSDPKSKAWSCALNFLSQLKNRSFWLFQWGNRCRNTGQDNEAVLSLYETQNSWSLPSLWLPRTECGATVSAPAIRFCQRERKTACGETEHATAWSTGPACFTQYFWEKNRETSEFLPHKSCSSRLQLFPVSFFLRNQWIPPHLQHIWSKNINVGVTQFGFSVSTGKTESIWRTGITHGIHPDPFSQTPGNHAPFLFLWSLCWFTGSGSCPHTWQSFQCWLGSYQVLQLPGVRPRGYLGQGFQVHWCYFGSANPAKIWETPASGLKWGEQEIKAGSVYPLTEGIKPWQKQTEHV